MVIKKENDKVNVDSQKRTQSTFFCEVILLLSLTYKIVLSYFIYLCYICFEVNIMHEMKLQDRYFNYILNGTKRIELRLLDEKRSKIKIGDTIKFVNIENNNEFICNVIGLYNSRSFDDLFKDFDISILADSSMTKDELKNVLYEFYTKELQEKYGVVGIRLELIK